MIGRKTTSELCIGNSEVLIGITLLGNNLTTSKRALRTAPKRVFRRVAARWPARSAMRHRRGSRASSHRTAGGEVDVVPWPLDGAVAWGCVDVAPPTADPGCSVLFSVPAAFGRLFVGSGVELLEPPAGGLCVVVSGFCASAGAAARMANAIISVFMTGVPLLFVGVKACRGGVALPTLPRCSSSAVMGSRGEQACRAAIGTSHLARGQRSWLLPPATALPGCAAERLKQPSL